MKKVPLKRVCRFTAGGTPDTNRDDYWADDGTPWISISDMSSRREVTSTRKGVSAQGIRAARLQTAPAGTVLFAMYASVGEVAFTTKESTWNQALLAITPVNKTLENRFLYYSLLNLRQNLPFYYRSNTQNNLNAEQVGSFQIQLPSRSQQQQIADYLDHETAEIDAFITDQSRFIDLIEERTSVLIETIITGKQPGTTLRKESGSAWVGDIPNHWEMERISWLFSNVGSGTTPASDDVDAFNGTIPWVTSSELRETGVSITKKLVSDEAVRKYSALRVHPAGSLMIAMYGATIGRLGWLEVPATVNQAICVFSDYRKGPSRYPFFALLAARRHLLTLASGGGQPNINQDKLRSLRIPIPPEHEQTDIVRSLDKSLRDATQLVREAKILIDLARERRAALITAAVTGQIDVTARNKPAAEQIEDDVAQGLHREYA